MGQDDRLAPEVTPGPGGYRKPANPAMVSGPGSLSQRTDGAPGQPVMAVTGQPYGQAQALQNQELAAPMFDQSDPGAGSATAVAGAASTAGQAPQAQGPPITPLHAPTAFPNEPITAGAPFGPGAGRSPAQAGFKVTDMLGTLLGSDVAGDLADLYLQAERMGL